MHAELLVNLHDQVGESPLWSPHDQALWWVDIEGRRLHRLDWATRQTQSWTTPQAIGCIALHAQGGLLAALQSGVFHLQPEASGGLQVAPVAAFQHARPDMRGNDGRCDRRGRFFVGTMVSPATLGVPAGALLRLGGDQRLVPLLHGLITPNGLAFSPDNTRMYLSDSHASVRRIWVCDLDEAGQPGPRQAWSDLQGLPGRPDGAAVDAEGGYWSCANDAGLVHQFSPDGRLVRSWPLPVRKPSMCAFVGPQLDWLAVTSIQEPASPQPPSPLAGAVFLLHPGVRGLPETPWDAGSSR